MATASFELRVGAGGVDRVTSTIERELAKATRPTALLVFCCGALSRQLLPLAEALSRIVPVHLPIVLASGHGVLTEHGEIEGDSGAAGLLLDAGRPELFSLAQPGDQALLELLQPSASPPTSLAFVRSELIESAPPRLLPLQEPTPVFGGGTVGDPGIAVVSGGRARTVGAAVLRLSGVRTPSLRVAHGCRLLGEAVPITRRDGPLALELGGQPALGLLKERGRHLDGRPVILAMLSDKANELGASSKVRPILGVDPDRSGVLLGPELEGATHLAFCVRDAAAARSNLESACRALRRDVAGAAPRFGIYINGSGRGRGLHGSPDVDTRVIRESFPKMPFAGFVPAFEIVPGPRVQAHTGTLCLVSSPS